MTETMKMTPQADLDQIAALADGALEGAEAQQAIDMLLASPALRAYWDELHVTGDLLRSDELLGHASSMAFTSRFAIRLALEPTILAPRARFVAPLGSRWVRYGLSGVSVAAAAAMVTWFAMPQLQTTAPLDAPVASSTPVAAPLESVAMSTPTTQRAVDPVELNQYLAAHQRFAATAIRGPGFIQAASLHSVRLEDSSH